MSTRDTNYLAGSFAINAVRSAERSLFTLEYTLEHRNVEESDSRFKLYLTEYMQQELEEQLTDLISAAVKIRELVRTRTTPEEQS